MTEVTAKRTVEKTVKEKVQAGKCLLCDSPGDSNRGLCCSHYFEFRRKLLSLPKSKRLAFESEQIREGRILASGQLRELKTVDAFPSEVT